VWGRLSELEDAKWRLRLSARPPGKGHVHELSALE
jgi:hypothetical protein